MSADGAIAERIDAAWAALSPQEQRVADFLRARPGESALYNSSELARLTGVSKATVSRLYRRLGFADSYEARDLLRSQRGAGVPVVLDRDGDRLSAQIAQDVANLRRLAADTDPREVEAAAATLASARRVVVIGLRTGRSVALQLRQALAQARPDVALAPGDGQSSGEEVAGLGTDDAVLLVAFRRRPSGTARLLDVLAESPARVVLITEPGGPTDPRFAHRFAVPVESAGAFDSYAAASALTSALADGVLRALDEAGAARVAAVGAAYVALGELDPS